MVFNVIDNDDPDYQKRLEFFPPYEYVVVDGQSQEDPKEEDRKFEPVEEIDSPFGPNFSQMNRDDSAKADLENCRNQSHEDSKEDSTMIVDRAHLNGDAHGQNGLIRGPSSNRNQTRNDPRDRNATQDNFRDSREEIDEDVKKDENYHKNIKSSLDVFHPGRGNQGEIKSATIKDEKHDIFKALENLVDDTASNQNKQTSKLEI